MIGKETIKLNFVKCLFVLAGLSFLSLVDKPREIKTDTYSGIIFAKHPFERGNSFVPTDVEIYRAESILIKRLVAIFGSDPDLSEESYAKKKKIIEDIKLYKRRYFGIVNTVKKKIIFIEFVHPNAISNDAWKSPKWGMDGGGHMFWSIRFNTESEMFYDLWINDKI